MMTIIKEKLYSLFSLFDYIQSNGYLKRSKTRGVVVFAKLSSFDKKYWRELSKSYSEIVKYIIKLDNLFLSNSDNNLC